MGEVYLGAGSTCTTEGRNPVGTGGNAGNPLAESGPPMVSLQTSLLR